MGAPRRSLELALPGGDVLGAEVAGSGPAILLLHGSGGNRVTWWEQVRGLAADHTVVVPDLRGSGRSSDAADLAGPVQQVADLEVLRAELGLDAWHVVGHSMGGWPAVRYAVEHPAAVRSCVALSSVAGVFPPPVDEHWQAFTRRLATEGWPPVQEVGRAASLPTTFSDADPDRTYLYQLLAGLNPPVSFTAPAMRIREADLDLAAVTACPVPLVFTVGEHDEVAPPAAVRAAAASVGRAFVELPGVGHLPFWEQPGEFARWLRGWLSSV